MYVGAAMIYVRYCSKRLCHNMNVLTYRCVCMLVDSCYVLCYKGKSKIFSMRSACLVDDQHYICTYIVHVDIRR